MLTVWSSKNRLVPLCVVDGSPVLLTEFGPFGLICEEKARKGLDVDVEGVVLLFMRNLFLCLIERQPPIWNGSNRRYYKN